MPIFCVMSLLIFCVAMPNVLLSALRNAVTRTPQGLVKLVRKYSVPRSESRVRMSLSRSNMPAVYARGI